MSCTKPALAEQPQSFLAWLANTQSCFSPQAQQKPPQQQQASNKQQGGGQHVAMREKSLLVPRGTSKGLFGQTATAQGAHDLASEGEESCACEEECTPPRISGAADAGTSESPVSEQALSNLMTSISKMRVDCSGQDLMQVKALSP